MELDAGSEGKLLIDRYTRNSFWSKNERNHKI